MSKLDANQLCAELCMITDFKKSTLVQHVPECPKYSAARDVGGERTMRSETAAKVKYDLISTKDLRRILKETLAQIRSEYGDNYRKHGRSVKDGANWFASNIEEFLSSKLKRGECGREVDQDRK